MTHKILVVENEKILLEGIRDVLERERYEVVTAENGRDALNILQTTERLPDLILSDVMMPIMDGHQFIQEVRQQPDWVDIPFIFLTAKTERADFNDGRRLGADDYLPKPFMTDELLLAVSSKLRRLQQIRQQHDVQVQDLKNNILTILHHEFRTPLTYVIGYSDLLKVNPEEITSDELRMLMGKIDTGAQRLRRLIENFILLVELETGNASRNFQLNSRIDNYKRALNNVINKYQHDAPLYGQNFVVDIDPTTPPVLTNSEYLAKIIDCLLDNAFKFTPRNGEISLGVYPHTVDNQSFVCFEVSDNGMGISDEDLPHVFEPFFQAVRQENEHPGTGTGLAIVEGLAELHGGSVEAASQLDMGSTFRVMLPAHVG